LSERKLKLDRLDSLNFHDYDGGTAYPSGTHEFTTGSLVEFVLLDL